MHVNTSCPHNISHSLCLFQYKKTPFLYIISHQILSFQILPRNSKPPFQHGKNPSHTPFSTAFQDQTSSSKLHKPHFKKYKRSYSNSSIPFYQSSKYHSPNTQNPRPRKSFSHINSSRFLYLHHLPRANTRAMPPPRLINPSESKRLMELFKNIQPGMSVILKGEIERLVYAAKLENIVFYLGNHYYTHLMGEFYFCSLRIGKSLDGCCTLLLLLMVG